MTFERVVNKRGAKNQRWLVLGMSLALGGCSFASDALFPSFSSDTSESAAAVAAPPPPTESSAGTLFSSTPVPAPVASTSYRGTTAVGQRVEQFRGEFEQLKANASTHGQQTDP